ncbi:MAG: hypothetical protein WCE61_06890 [Candidatus Acidiferrum sp.]
MAWRVAEFPANADFRKVGFKVFSQFDEDGIIQYLVHKLPIANKTFIEFGVENYEESNTRFLLLNVHWRGMVLDARAMDIRYIQKDKIYWQYDLQAKCAWITRENINPLLRDAGFGEDVGLLSIDVDGNDYWIWEAIQSVRPLIVIIEYNSLLGLHPIAVPYKEEFDRTAAHYSNLYYGASLGALDHLDKKKGYLLLGSNVWGHNAFFIREDIAGEFRGLELPKAYVESKFRESRDPNGNLTYLRGTNRITPILDMPVLDVVTGKPGKLEDFWKAP